MANPALCKKHVRVHFHIVPIITPRSSMCTIHNIPGNKNVSIHMITCTVSTVGQKNRPGTAQDIIALKSAMGYLDFRTLTFKDLTVAEIRRTIAYIAQVSI